MSADLLVFRREQYDEILPDRCQENEILVGGLVLVLFAIKDTGLALSFPARITRIGQPYSNSVDFVSLNADFRPLTLPLLATVLDGFITNRVNLWPVGYSEQGFFTGYDDGVSDELDYQSKCLNIPCLINT